MVLRREESRPLRSAGLSRGWTIPLTDKCYNLRGDGLVAEADQTLALLFNSTPASVKTEASSPD